MAKTSVLLCFSTFLFASLLLHGYAAKPKLAIYELKKGNFSIKFTNWGATVVSVFLPDKHGKLADVVLGFDSIEEYMNDTSYFGSIVGRVANRIRGAQFTLNGHHYKLVPNKGKDMLHGGLRGFSDVPWSVSKYEKNGDSPHIVFTYNSVDGEEGFPGDVNVSVEYKILGENRLSVSMKAKALNKPTPVNLALHTYWNLGGHDSGTIWSEELQLFGSHITVLDSDLIPTGKLESVKGTPYDFLEPHIIGSRIKQLPSPSGYDINYALDDWESGEKLRKVAVVHDRKSGRTMKLWTDAPGVQLYTSNDVPDDTKGKGGFVYKAHAAVCLETQGFPDAVNHDNFPSVIVTKDKPYHHNMLFEFSTK